MAVSGALARWSCPTLGLVEEVRPRERLPDAARLRLLQRIARAEGFKSARTRRRGEDLLAELPNGRLHALVYRAGFVPGRR